MNANVMMNAIKEMVKQYASIENEDEYRNSCIKMIERTFDLTETEAEILLYLSEGDGYTYKWDWIDFTLIWREKENKITARVYRPWNYYNTIYEFDANLFIRNIIRSLNDIDLDYQKLI